MAPKSASVCQFLRRRRSLCRPASWPGTGSLRVRPCPLSGPKGPWAGPLQHFRHCWSVGEVSWRGQLARSEMMISRDRTENRSFPAGFRGKLPVLNSSKLVICLKTPPEMTYFLSHLSKSTLFIEITENHWKSLFLTKTTVFGEN